MQSSFQRVAPVAESGVIPEAGVLGNGDRRATKSKWCPSKDSNHVSRTMFHGNAFTKRCSLYSRIFHGKMCRFLTLTTSNPQDSSRRLASRSEYHFNRGHPAKASGCVPRRCLSDHLAYNMIRSSPSGFSLRAASFRTFSGCGVWCRTPKLQIRSKGPYGSHSSASCQ